jgi:hypothetical protein
LEAWAVPLVCGAKTAHPPDVRMEGLTEQPRGGRRDNRPLEESPDTAGQGGREADPGKPAGKCHRNKPPKLEPHVSSSRQG